MRMGIWNDIRDLFFPRTCLICGNRLAMEEEHLCFQCMVGLPRTQMHQKKENEVEKSFWGKLPIERASSFLYYAKGGNVRRLMYEIKYYGNSKLAFFLGCCMAEELKSSGFFEGIDYIVPVPLSARKQKKRGYNQSELLADGIASILGIPVEKNVLVKRQDTETQTRKGNYERWINVKDAFVCADRVLLENKHVLLVDDVMTTGATIVACSDGLADVVGLRISVLTLALAKES